MAPKIDFLPDDYIEKKLQQRTNVICLLLLLLVAAGVGAGFFIIEKKQQTIKKREFNINQEMAQAGQSLQQLELLESKKKMMLTKAQTSAMLMESVPRSLLMAIITNDLPSGVSLTSYELKTKETAHPTSSSKKDPKNKRKSRDPKAETEPAEGQPAPKIDTTIEITGLAPTDKEVSQFIANLNTSELFQQVNLTFTEEHKLDNEIMRRFELVINLNPRARASEEDVKLAQKKHITGM